jgi:UDP-N-acetylglucosamine 1-carboxyvinyltransferase
MKLVSKIGSPALVSDPASTATALQAAAAQPALPDRLPDDLKKSARRGRGIRIVDASRPESIMDKFVIRGGNPLVGSVRVSGAKNAALPAMAAALLTSEPVILENIPDVRDIQTERNLLVSMGAEVELGYGRASHRTTISCRNLVHPEAAYELVKTMRASTLVLGPLVARMGRARVSQPGGCAIGARPIDLHVKGLERLGATIKQEHGYIEATADRLRGGHIIFDKITVTGTEDLLMAATLAQGETVMENCAREPEVVDLAALLTKMGAKIQGAGTHTIRIQGVESLHGARHRIIPDRIEAGTFVIAAVLTGGDLTLTNCDPAHLGALVQKLEECGVRITAGADSLRVTNGHQLIAADISTEEYPGFPTDMQAQFMTLATQAEGTSIITENIFENRFMHAQELVRMGANIKVEGRRAIVRGRTPLSSAAVQCSDLRASASLVIAALVADGETIIDRVYHIDRGYERIEEKLKSVGAQVRRIGEILPRRSAAPSVVA